jgi:hypothetical protein
MKKTEVPVYSTPDRRPGDPGYVGTSNDKPSDLISSITQTTAVSLRPEQLKLKRKLTMDATSIARLGQLVCRIYGEFETIEMGGPNKDGFIPTAQAIPIFDVVRQEEYLLVCNALIVSAFKRAVPPLIGRYFALRSGEIVTGKRYRHVDVMELEVAE